MRATKTANRLIELLPRILSACESPPRKGDSPLTPALARLADRLDPEIPRRVTEVAALLGVTPSTASLGVDRLEEKGFALREKDPGDGRRVLLRLTPAGVRAREASGPLDRGRVEALVERLSPGRRRRALRGLKALAEAADGVLGERTRSRAWGRRRAEWRPPPPVPGAEGDSP